VTLALAWPLGRRRGRAGVLFVLVLGGILAATTTTSVVFLSAGGMRPYLTGFGDPAHLFRGFAGNQERVANILLFLPLGLLGTLLWRRPAVVLAACVALSFLVEAWQGFIGRGGDALDVVHNSAGALIGVLLARGWTYLASQGTV
jgi:glycopeptide antibiotics resistance protein